jgi:hypothetical protein
LPCASWRTEVEHPALPVADQPLGRSARSGDGSASVGGQRRAGRVGRQAVARLGRVGGGAADQRDDAGLQRGLELLARAGRR